MSRCRRHGRARRKARAAGRLLAERIMAGAYDSREGDVGRIIRRIVHAAGDDAVRACGELRRPRLVSVSAHRFVVRWPDVSAASALVWMRQRLVLSTPMWLRTVQWVVMS